MRELAAKSGYHYPNRIARIYLQAMEEIVGRNGLKALLNLIGMKQYIDEFPPLNLDKEFDFADFSNLNQGILNLYGLPGGGGLSLRAGRATFDKGLRGFGLMAGMETETFQRLPEPKKVQLGMTALARVFNQFTDQRSTVGSSNGNLQFSVERCPFCWGQQSHEPICFVNTGILEEAIRWMSGGRDYRVEEIECRAAGDDACIFTIDNSSAAR